MEKEIEYPKDLGVTKDFSPKKSTRSMVKNDKFRLMSIISVP